MCRSVESKYYPLNNHYLKCGDNWINNSINGIILLLFIFIVPFLLWKQIKIAKRDRMMKKCDIFYKRKFGFFLMLYEEKYFFWEFI